MNDKNFELMKKHIEEAAKDYEEYAKKADSFSLQQFFLGCKLAMERALSIVDLYKE